MILYNRLLFNLNKEGDFDMSYNTDKLGRHYTKWDKPITKGQTLYDSNYRRYYDSELGEKKEWRLSGTCKGKMGSCRSMGYRVSVWEAEKVLQMESGDVCTMWMHSMPLTYTLKIGYNGKFYVMFILQ